MVIDKENVAIEKIFRMSLFKDKKFYFLEDYSLSLSSEKKDLLFRLADLSNLTLTILNEFEEKVE